ncbi:MAG: HupE/UreJ family protein [Beijerinckiaceae bacterium]|nr:HupE/UreJ family protein [Beijerinckiaceae bacterium]
MGKLQALRRAPAAAVAAIVLAYAPSATAHKTSYAYLNATFAPGAVSGKLELAVRDFDAAFFDFAFGPGDGGGKLNLAQLHRHEQEIAGLLLSKFSIGPPGAACSLKPLAIALDSRGGEDYMILPFLGLCEPPGGELQVGYDLMFDIDAEHRAVIDLRRESEICSGVMTPETRVLHFGTGTKHLSSVILAYVRQGAHHIWIGYDHILFLVSLLLPAVVTWTKQKWLPVDGFAGAFRSTAKVVTAFTLAHSVTLSAAAFGIIELPSRFVESVIAASVAAAAINNLFPVMTRRLWAAAFVFGLIHGFGFASVLSEFGLPPGQKLAALLAFNTGVELGQLAIVAALLPMLFLARRTIAYTRVVMPGGSAAISVIALIWFVERATGTS